MQLSRKFKEWGLKAIKRIRLSKFREALGGAFAGRTET